MREFLARTPCQRLNRMLFALGDGNIAVLAVSWVEFRGRTAARRFRDISDTYGTGQFNDEMLDAIAEIAAWAPRP
ncbi:MAG: hypothetical protein ACRDTB_06415 [Actinophytocola sp.]